MLTMAGQNIKGALNLTLTARDHLEKGRSDPQSVPAGSLALETGIAHN